MFLIVICVVIVIIFAVVFFIYIVSCRIVGDVASAVAVGGGCVVVGVECVGVCCVGCGGYITVVVASVYVDVANIWCYRCIFIAMLV